MKKILFLIHDLGQGGAEKVLVNLVNNMDRNKFEDCNKFEDSIHHQTIAQKHNLQKVKTLLELIISS